MRLEQDELTIYNKRTNNNLASAAETHKPTINKSKPPSKPKSKEERLDSLKKEQLHKCVEKLKYDLVAREKCHGRHEAFREKLLHE